MHAPLRLVLKLLFAAMAALALPTVARAAPVQPGPVQADHVEAELVAERLALVPGEDTWLALRLKTEPGWHTYWRNPGDSGIPTQLNWTLPPGFSAGAIVWPYPERHALGEVTNYGYEGETLHLVNLSVPADSPAGKPVLLKAQAKWLVCSDICIPGEAQLSLSLPTGASAQPNPRWQKLFVQTRARLPEAVQWPALFAADSKDFSLHVELPEAEAAGEIEFFPYAKDLVNHAEAQRQQRDGRALRLSQQISSFFLEAPAKVDGVLVLKRRQGTQAYEIAAAPGTVAAVEATQPVPPQPEATPGLALVLLFALLGGLILNLMPCVFPVLSLKAIAVMEAHDGRERSKALAYTAGVILSFLAVAAALLALRAGGQALGWGFQLQSPVVVAALAYLFFVMALSLSGVAELGAGFMGLGQSLTQSGGLAGSFFTGVLATVVASPCTAPFMGSALGYALTQPTITALAVFATLGLGLALPFLLMGLFPRLAAWLPKPGAWMESFKQLMAFPLYLSVVWLLWVLARQSSADSAAVTMIGLVVLALALWLRRFATWPAHVLRWLLIAVALGLLAHPLIRTPMHTMTSVAAETEPYSEARLAQLRAEHRTVFVNFTADWCLTCKVNERAVLQRQAVREAFAQHRIAELVGDWTRPDPVITAALARFERAGVPLYLVYRDGQEAQVLPQILTQEMLIKALTAPKE
jgi:thiol:disulfide interchange protein DsbD